jgi:hypothetical protein
MSLTTATKDIFDKAFEFNQESKSNDEQGIFSKGLGVAAQTAFDTVKTKIGSEALNLVGIGNGAATWGESFAAAGAANAYETMSGKEMGFMSKMALTQGVAYGLHKFNDGEGGGMLKNLGLGGLTAGGLAVGTSMLSNMNAGDGLGNAFDKLFETIGEYADKYLGEGNVVSKTLGSLGLDKNHEKPDNKLGLSDSQSSFFENFDVESKLKDFVNGPKNDNDNDKKRGLSSNLPGLTYGG